MKRYIIASHSSSNKLVSALSTVLLSTLDMGDYVEDIVEGLADMGEIDLPEDYDPDEMLNSVLTQLVNQRSAVIPDSIIYSFTEYPDVLLEEISTSSPSGKKSNLYKAIYTIYSQMDTFPNGSAVKAAIEDNIFSSDLIDGNAAEIGYIIGSTYWKYIKSPEYGVRTNDAATVGVSIGCREAISGKYKYAFVQDISSYYYSDLRKGHPEMPAFTGYMVKFYNDGNAVCADVFNMFVISDKNVQGVAEWEISDQILHTFTITEFDDIAIEAVSQDIARWYDDHVQEAIAAAVQYI